MSQTKRALEEREWNLAPQTLATQSEIFKKHVSPMMEVLITNEIKLIEKIELLRKTLQFYADPINWGRMGDGAYADIGKTAREALKRLRNM